MNQIQVLLVEDDDKQSSILTETLKKNDFSIVGVAKTYREALSIILKEKIDILIIDIYLGGIPDGIALAETITEMPHKMKPFLFLTSSNDRRIFERARLTHPYSYLIKPWNELELVYAIETAVERFYDQHDAFSDSEENAVISNEYLYNELPRGRAPRYRC